MIKQKFLSIIQLQCSTLSKRELKPCGTTLCGRSHIPICSQEKTGNLPNQNIFISEWEDKRSRIIDLYKTHTLRAVQEVMAREGFLASDKQFKTHLELWGESKYIRLSNQQYAYIARTTEERANEGKKTSFLLADERVSSKNIQRNLRAKIAKSVITETASTSADGLVPYTSSTLSDGVLLKEPLKQDPRLAELKKRYPKDNFEITYSPVDKNLVFHCADCQVNDARPYQRANVEADITSFERLHLLDRYHRNLVQIRLSNLQMDGINVYDRQRCFHLTLLEHLTLLCGHILYPETENKEDDCWGAGGCGWWRQQLKDNTGGCLFVDGPEACQCWRLKINDGTLDNPFRREIPDLQLQSVGEQVLPVANNMPDVDTNLNFMKLTKEQCYNPQTGFDEVSSGFDFDDGSTATWVETLSAFGGNLEWQLEDLDELPGSDGIAAIRKARCHHCGSRYWGAGI